MKTDLSKLAADEKSKRRQKLNCPIDTILTLKEGKGFSYRQIAVWLNAHGVVCDYSMVYRAYNNFRKSSPVCADSDGATGGITKPVMGETATQGGLAL